MKYIYVFIIIAILLIVIMNKTQKECFTINFFENNYQELIKRNDKITIQLKPELINPIKVLFNQQNESEKNILDKIKQLYPIIYKYKELNWNRQIDLVNKKTEFISMIQEDILFDAFNGIKLYSNNSMIQKYPNIHKYYKYNTQKNNLSFICSFFYVHFTLLVPSKYNIDNWSQIKGYTIGTLNSDPSFYNLVCILYSLNYQDLVVVNTFDTMEQLVEAFYNDDIDMLYISTQHPNKMINNISKEKSIKLIFDSGLDPTKIGFYFPVSFKSNVDISQYKYMNQINKNSSSFASRVIIVTNKNTNVVKIYDLIKTIFKNIHFIKANQPYLEILRPHFMISLNRSVIYHSGCIKYYKELGYITNNDNIYCALNVGAGNCTMNKIKENNIDIRNYFGNQMNYQDNFKKYISDYQIQPKQKQFYPNPIFKQTFDYFL